MFAPLFEGQVCSLGYAAIDFIEQYMVHGPGDIEGTPVEVDDEMADFLIEMYRLDPETGRRAYDEGVLSRPKGRAKSEIAGFVVVWEAYGECRFDHWDEAGQPVGRRVTSPIIKCMATEESQAGNTFENAAYIVNWGMENMPEVYAGSGGIRQVHAATTIYLPDGGYIAAVTSGAASKDGGKETFAVADETHLYVLKELKRMFETMSRNLSKRKQAEPWLLQTSTAYRPGEMSVFEDTLTAWRKKELSNRVHVDHREAKGKIDIANYEHTIKQLNYVYGASVPWQDMDRKWRDMNDPRKCPDEETAARYYLNRPLSSSDAWIPAAIVEKQDATQPGEGKDTRERPDTELAPKESIALGFDGSLNDDSTVLIGCRMSDGFLFPIGIWAKPAGPAGMWWEVPRSEVLETIRQTFKAYTVSRLYADPHEWRTDIDDLEQEFGETVIPWATSRYVPMAAALDRLHVDLKTGQAWHSGDPVFMEHFRNAYVKKRGPHRLVGKENPNSERKIDSVVGAALAYEARADAITAGWKPPTKSKVRVWR
ncbi:phage terminase large subunit-like protein [Curtobacterium sp. 320]|uniref:terminase large subunit domain-containing protein n=1 Tax=Curtobacterium sp. 320 TaxID=2817749 RepID=UPI0028556892|nr:terminase large subunit [Curtobacterium sp. 320]MDR6574346.1 phage terminase large subunit-like protein [Curtobacterium sp. 320]